VVKTVGLRGVALVACIVMLDLGRASAQQPTVDLPERRNLFAEDSKAAKRARSRAKRAALEVAPSADKDVDFKAPQVEFLKERNEIKGSGGVVVAGRGVQAQADEAVLNTETKDAALRGNVLFSTARGQIGAQAATINMDREVGTFTDADLLLEEGNYAVRCGEAKRLSESEFEFAGAAFSTCACADEDGTLPWVVKSDRAHVTREGYAHTYGATMNLYGVPVFYTPYLFFPVKENRASGLLAGQYGYGGENGLALRQPIFAVIDEHSDLTFDPFIETKTRWGSGLDVRRYFSRYNSMSGRFVYSNERLRDGDLRGADVSNLFDPPVDENGEFDENDRFGAAFRQLWRSAPDAPAPASFVADVHYVSDDLLLRELDEPLIGEAQDRYATSTLAVRASPLEFMSAEVRGEYNQGLRDDDDDLLLQRLPEFSVGALKSFRPFGFNPYGLKVVTRADVLATDFVRQDGYDGWRTDINPRVSVPFHYRNYLASALSVGFRTTMYDLDNRIDPESSVELEANQDRRVWNMGYALGTSLERVYDLEPGNWLSDLTSYGVRAQGKELVRLKHTVEPQVSYLYIPDTSQDQLPLYDSLDRIREKSLFVYGFTSRLYGKFASPLGSAGEIPELAPRLDELPIAETSTALGDLGSDWTTPFGGDQISPRSGEIREIANFSLRQGYDYKEDVEDNDPDREGFSDVNARVGLFPSTYAGFIFDTNYGLEGGGVSSWGIQNHLKDDRGDALRLRYSFIDATSTGGDELSQLEGQVEVKLSDRLKVGYYARYDETDREFIDSSVGLRVLSSCNCWHLDLGYTEKLNPDREQVTLRFTFAGLGDITQDIGTGSNNRRGR
jgi:LPS-assembly protein